tara:strand:- start:75 stop:428 length:354 start_codon:yes stop_codon:yes gene_type:complete
MENNNTYSRTFNTEDFIISLRPIIDNANHWTGQVAVDITSSEKSPLNNTDYNHVFHLCKLMCSIIPMMEEDSDLTHKLDAFVKEYDLNRPKEDKLIVSDVNDNVIKLDWSSTTKGKA